MLWGRLLGRGPGGRGWGGAGWPPKPAHRLADVPVGPACRGGGPEKKTINSQLQEENDKRKINGLQQKKIYKKATLNCPCIYATYLLAIKMTDWQNRKKVPNVGRIELVPAPKRVVAATSSAEKLRDWKQRRHPSALAARRRSLDRFSAPAARSPLDLMTCAATAVHWLAPIY